MWTTLLVLAIAVNFEPTRIGVIALLMIRPNPIPQLLAFLTGIFITSGAAGLLVLLALHHAVPSENRFNGAKIQIAIGIIAVIAAVVLAASGKAASPDSVSTQPRIVEWITERAGRVVEGSSPWFAAALGIGLAIPSVDYLALLLLIATSGLTLTAQTTALLTFLTVANVVVLLPLTSYLMSPDKTKAALDRLRTWVLARRRRDYAVLLGIAGGLMIAVGISGM